MQKPFYTNTKGATLYKADSLQLLKEVGDESVDMIFADPPYFLSSGTFSVHNGKRVSVKKGDWDLSNGVDKNLEFHIEWIKESKRILKPNGTIWISGTYHSIYQCGYALQANHFHILNDISWFKPNASPNLSCRFFTASHETLIWARKDPKGKHTYNYEDMKRWSTKNDIIKRPNKQMRSVWVIPTPSKKEKIYGKHPTQKPIELLQRVIISSTNKGDLILDPFTGSSTTGVVALELGRKFIGIDNNDEYLELSKKRLENINNLF